MRESSTRSICFVSPYLPKHTGGGERYLFDCARLAAEDHQVYVAIPGQHTASELETYRQKYQAFLGDSLEKFKFVAGPIFTPANFWQKLIWTKQFDVIYHQTDGSLFFSLAKRNILHIQIPLKLTNTGWLFKLKLLNWQIVNTNSEFTKRVVEKYWHRRVDLVHWPMVALPASTKPITKQKVILNVGRFFRQLHSKRQDVLVEIFRQLRQDHPKLTKDWQLVLIGTVEDESYAQEVAELAQDLPVKILHHADRDELLAWYDKAAIYWHATGYELDEDQDPEKMEHFGITTIEAMSRQDAPVVIAKGGQKEILGQQLAYLSWQTKSDCVKVTAKLIKDQKLLATAQQQAQHRAAIFGQDRFVAQLMEMIDG
jgi:glycosyltransferase involved in cell wall biosynthesis